MGNREKGERSDLATGDRRSLEKEVVEGLGHGRIECGFEPAAEPEDLGQIGEGTSDLDVAIGLCHYSSGDLGAKGLDEGDGHGLDIEEFFDDLPPGRGAPVDVRRVSATPEA